MLFFTLGFSMYSQDSFETVLTQNDKEYSIRNVKKIKIGEYDFWIKIIEFKKEKTTIIHVNSRCSSKTYDLTTFMEYNKDGEAVDNGNFNDYNSEAIPGSALEYVINYVCRKY